MTPWGSVAIERGTLMDAVQGLSRLCAEIALPSFVLC